VDIKVYLHKGTRLQRVEITSNREGGHLKQTDNTHKQRRRESQEHRH
jgi:hypothetical protein